MVFVDCALNQNGAARTGRANRFPSRPCQRTPARTRARERPSLQTSRCGGEERSDQSPQNESRIRRGWCCAHGRRRALLFVGSATKLGHALELAAELDRCSLPTLRRRSTGATPKGTTPEKIATRDRPMDDAGVRHATELYASAANG